MKTLTLTRWIAQSAVAASLALLCSSPADGSLIVLDLTTGGAAGTDLDNGLSHTASGLTLSASANGGVVNASGESLGVNVVGVGGEDADQIDAPLEDLSFTLTFASSLNVSLTSLDLIGVGPSAGDEANISFNGGPVTVLQTGAADFNGSTDLWTPAGGVSLSSGDTIKFTAGNTFGLQAIEFDVSAIPEPSAFLVWSFGATFAGFLYARRKR